MKSIRLILLIVLSVMLLFISLQIDWTGGFFSIANINGLFGIFMCGILFIATVILTDKMIKVDKILYPKSSLIWLLFSFGLMCCSLIVIACFKNSFYQYVGGYILFFSNASLCIGNILVIRQKIRNKKSD